MKKEYPKDFKNVELKLERKEEESWIQVKQLRQEAIKHIKRIGMVSGKTKNKFKRYQLIGQMVWIKDFFNITGEDLNGSRNI